MTVTRWETGSHRPTGPALRYVEEWVRRALGEEESDMARSKGRPSDDEPYLRVLRQIHPGEWTTYGDVAKAAGRGANAARAVGSAAKRAEFRTHRVLLKQGVIPQGWRSDDGRGPEECQQRLLNEGVRVMENGRADPARYVSSETLRERAKNARGEEE